MSAKVIYAKIPILHGFEIVYLDKIKLMIMKNFTYLILFMFLLPIVGQSQAEIKKEIALQYVKETAAEKGFKAADVENMLVTDIAHHKHNGVYSVYLNQTFEGIPIDGATYNINILNDNKVIYNRNNYIADVKSRVKHTEASITPEQAVNAVANDLYIALTKKSTELKKVSDIHYVYDGVNLSRENLDVKLMYVQDEKGDLILTWNMTAYVPTNVNSWYTHVNARTGEIVSKTNLTHYCALHNMDFSRPSDLINHSASKHDNCTAHQHDAKQETTESSELESAAVSGSYRAYALPAESPNHGSQVMVENPHFPEASPNGWHTINGTTVTFTRGNNVHAFADPDGNQSSDGTEPDGGSELIFDFAHQTDQEGDQNYDAAVVNLFYMNNIAHDLLQLYGFDEANGNFQFENFGNVGQGGDEILAIEATPNPDTGEEIWNNASWTNVPDGVSPRMSMGIWQSNSSIFQLSSPEQIEGPYQVSGAGDDWGFNWTVDEIDLRDVEIALARDASIQSPTQCCGDIVNADEVEGKIALIDRGLCEFGTKALNAQNAGAVGVIICNLEGVNGGSGEELIGIAPGADGGDVDIPTVFSSKSTCDLVKAAIGSGNSVTGIMSTMIEQGPLTFNSSFDNGVILHEYGHGFNGRFLGGANNTTGLSNNEQMGEGWSDFFSVAFTVQEGDTGATPRGVGTYLLGQNPQGRGIRSFPYSTDMGISPYTYDDIIGENEAHAIGEIWTAVLWDVYWFFIDTYGFDPDFSNQDSGNGRGLRLIMDGVGFVGASPGFADARDALLVSDEVNFGGVHNCDLWSIFARRGLGFFADQGSPQDSNDGVEDFETRPTCIEELKIRRSTADLVLPGEEMEVIMDVWNHTLVTQTNVVVTDFLTDGLTYVAGSSTGPEPTVDGNTLSFAFGDMPSLDEQRFTFRVSTDIDNKSESLFYDPVDADVGNEWDIDFLEGFDIFQTTSSDSNSPSFSWTVNSPDEESKQELYYRGLFVEGANPALRFYTKYNTVLSADGGYVDISTDEGVTWNRTDNDYIQGGPNQELRYATFAIASLPGFSGFQDEWIPAYIDLRDYLGQTIWVRWNYGADDTAVLLTPANIDGTVVTEEVGWFIDDLELLDLRKYETSACVNSNETTDACTETFATIVDASLPSKVEDLSEEGYTMKLAPNPADDRVEIQIGSLVNERAQLELKTVDGKILSRKLVDVSDLGTNVNLDLSGLSSGLYFVTLQSGNKVLTKKLMIN